MVYYGHHRSIEIFSKKLEYISLLLNWSVVEHVQQPNQYPNWHVITNFKLYVILQRTYHQTFLTNLNRIGRWRTTAAARWMVARHIAPIHHLIRTPCEWKLFVVLRKNGLHKFNEHRSTRIAEKEWITNLKKNIFCKQFSLP